MILKIFVLVSSTLICCYSVISTSCPKSQYTELQGTMASPGFNTSESYGENMSCVYSINLPRGRRIILELKMLSILGTMPNCPEDSLEIFFGCSRNESIGKFCSCANVSIPKVYSYDNCMTLVFRSDGSKKGAGFKAQYTSTDNNATKLDPSQNCSNILIGGSSGTIFTPNWPLNYPSSITCQWLFNIPGTKVARIFFTSFVVDPNIRCNPNRSSLSGDEIRITGTNREGKQVAIKQRLCDLPDPAFFPVTNMQSVQVNFASNGDGQEFSGVILDYATYIEGALGSGEAGCEAIGLPTTGTPTTDTPTTAAPEGLSVGAKVGIGIGVLAALAVIALIVYYIYTSDRRCCSQPAPTEPQESMKPLNPDPKLA